MINLLLRGILSGLSVLTVVIIWALVVWVLAAFAGFNDKEDS